MRNDKKGNCITKNYEILINPNFNIFQEGAEFGQVYDRQKEKVVLLAFYYPNLYREAGYHFCASSGSPEECGIVQMDMLYLKYFMDYPDCYAFSMLHELGHFKNGDMKPCSITNSDLKRKRTEILDKGKADPKELKADLFAVEQLGPNTAIKALEYMREQRRTSNRLGNELAIKEFDIRIKAIKNYFKDRSRSNNKDSKK